MILSEKDKVFIEKLKKLVHEKELAIEAKGSGCTYLVLRQNYGDKVETGFGMSRQGVRWRFHRIFNDIYIGAYETIYFVETSFGTSLRPAALEIVRERVALRKKAQNLGFVDASRREDDPSVSESGSPRL